MYSAGVGLTYSLGHDIHLTMRYDLNNQQVEVVDYSRTNTRASIGLMFSPGNRPCCGKARATELWTPLPAIGGISNPLSLRSVQKIPERMGYRVGRNAPC